MPKEFIEETGKPAGIAGEGGNITRAILFVLLLLTAVLGYLYFFTGLIKPREYIAKAPPPKVEPVKHPLPPRPGLDAPDSDSAPEPAEPPPAVKAEQEPSPASPDERAAQTHPPKAGPAGAPVAAPAPPSSPKPAEVKGKPATPAGKPDKKVVGKVAAGSSAPSVKSGTVKSVKPAAAPAVKAKASPGPRKQEQGAFSLLVGEFASDREAERARQKLAKMGITAVNSRKSRKVEAMHRLFLAEFADREAAEAELVKLRPIADGAFILRENGRYSLYAGSYLREKGASSEAKRLAAKGIKVVPRTAAVTLPMCELTAGPFPDREKAQREADRLKKNGFAARVVGQGK